MPEQFVVRGRVRGPEGRPLEAATVRAFDRDLRHEELLGEAETDADGLYELAYTDEQFRRAEKRRADLLVRVFDGATQLAASDLLKNAPAEAEIDLVVVRGMREEPSEYERVAAELEPLLDGVAPADLTDDDLAFLDGEAELDRRMLALFRDAAVLGHRTGLPDPAFYGFGRVGLPLDLPTLARRPAAELREALARAVAEQIAPAALRERIDEIVRRLTQREHLAYVFLGRLLEQARGEPLVGYAVRGTLVDGAGDSAQELGPARTDPRGRFGLLYTAPRSEDAGREAPRLRLVVDDPAGQTVYSTDLRADLEQREPIELRVLAAPDGRIPETSLEALAADERIELTPALRAVLDERGIRTLADFRARGGIAALRGRSVPLDDPGVRFLSAHADLAGLTGDLELSGKLIEHQYDSVEAIAIAARHQLIEALGDEVGDARLVELHAAARAQDAVLNNALAEQLTRPRGAAGQPGPQPGPPDPAAVPTGEHCGCRDCEAAVSPAAYLADLLQYTLQHLHDGAQPITLPILTATFHQPFGDLPASCKAVERRVRQVRLCIESLRSYLGTTPPAADRLPALEEAERAYRLAAYRQLLVRLGTSFEELRLARTASADVRTALAERLGFDLGERGPSGDELDRLLLDPTGTIAGIEPLAESALETLFGLVDTTRDPLSDGVRLGDPAPEQLVRWNLDGVGWGRNTDPDGRVHVRISAQTQHNLPQLYRVELFRDAGRTQLVAVGERPMEDGPVRLLPANASGLSGLVELRFGAGSDTIEIAALPALLGWRLRRLRRIWREQDRPPDAYNDDAPVRLLLVDPDLIGPDDIRVAPPGAPGPGPATQLWRKRRAWVDGRLQALAAQPSLEAGLNSMYASVAYDAITVTPWAATTLLSDFDALAAQLGSSDREVVAAAARRLHDDLALTVEAFNRLLALRALSTPLPAEEAAEAHSIMVQAAKRRLFDAWRTEEVTAGLMLGPEAFWIAQREPREGSWPPATTGGPLLDPELVEAADLPEVDGAAARQRWTQRRQQLAQVPTQLRAVREGQGSDAMLRLALGRPGPTDPPPHDLDTLRSDLLDLDQQVADAALRKVETDLHLSVGAFERLLAIRAKAASPIPTEQPTPADWAELEALLASPYVVNRLHATWRNEEQQAGLTTTYWRALKARLPRWRSSAEARRAWQQALRARSRPPILDPDLVGLADLVDPLAGPAAALRESRRLWLDQQLAELTQLRQGAADDAAAFEVVTRGALGVTGAELTAVEVDARAGRSVEARLAQLSLEPAEATVLFRARALATDGALLEADWDEILAILVQARKRRFFAAWRAAEAGDGITISSDFFRLSEPLQAPAGAVLPELRWRVSAEARRHWLDTLQARLEQQVTVAAVLPSAVAAVEEATLPGLRDALVIAAAAHGDSLVERAEWITHRLFLDARIDGCRETTRVAQAIETLQGLLFAARTGQIARAWAALQGAAVPIAAPHLSAPFFDREWEWIGSYPTWRAAMFVFLYPQNLLAPTLRAASHQTPGFTALVRRVRTGRLTPEDACARAREYADYFADVCSLEVEATCQVPTRVTGDPCGVTSDVWHQTFFMFARAGRSGRAYWAAYDTNDPTGYAQSFWEELTLLNDVEQIVGAAAYVPPGQKRRICIVAVRRKEAGRELIVLHFDPESRRTVGDPHPLAAPEGATSFTALVRQHDVEGMPPQIGLQLSNTKVYAGPLNADATKFADGQPQLYAGLHASDQLRQIHAMLGFGGSTSSTWVWESPNDLRAHLPGGGIGGIAPQRIESKATYVGTAWMPTSVAPGSSGYVDRHFFLLYRDGADVPRIMVNFKGAGWWDPRPGIPEIDALVPTGGAIGRWGTRHYVYRASRRGSVHVDVFKPVGAEVLNDQILMGTVVLPSDQLVLAIASSGVQLDQGFGGIVAAPPGDTVETTVARDPDRYYRCWFERRQDWSLGLRDAVSVAPSVLDPLDVPTRLDAAGLQARRAAIASAWSRNLGTPPSVTTYLEEAYYSVPMLLALQLQRQGEYVAALDLFRTVYDYTAPPAQRKIWYGLQAEESLSAVAQRAASWLRDPLDPHGIAATRRDAHTQFVVMSIVRCLLDFADAEFTRDTAESLAHARLLYTTARDLLDESGLPPPADRCAEQIAQLEITLDEPEAQIVVGELKQLMAQIGQPAQLTSTIQQVQAVMAGDEPWPARLRRARTIVEAGRVAVESPTLDALTEGRGVRRAVARAALVANPLVAEQVAQAGQAAGLSALDDLATLAGIEPGVLVEDQVEIPWLRPTPNGAAGVTPPTTPFAGPGPDGLLAPGFVPSADYAFCIPANPVPSALRLHAEVNLHKLLTCRNIAGLKREVEPYAGPTDAVSGLPSVGPGGQLVLPGTGSFRPTPYRYAVLIERAKQLVQIAGQIEATMLAAIEKRDEAALAELQARQQLGVAEAGVRLQELRLTEANDGVELAKLQQARAELQQEHYQRLLDEGMIQAERQAITYLTEAAEFQATASTFNFLAAIVSGAAGIAGAVVGGTVGSAAGPAGTAGGSIAGAVAAGLAGAANTLSSISAGYGNVAAKYSTRASIESMIAGYERRRQEWELAEALARQDVAIGEQQQTLARDRVEVVRQEQVIADLGASNARDILEFLTTKRFGTAELYEWMSGVLERVYSYFLQQATAMASLAAQQLAFERQQPPPAFIQADYWEAPRDSLLVAGDGRGPDRRGVTGSARLVEDIQRLDQYAFETNTRKLQLSRTISLARRSPAEFQRFRESGLLTFATPMELFDRDFPGHYLRLIKNVRASIIALIPPVVGIRATLSTSGVSRVTIGGDLFQTVVVRRDPEMMALSAPSQASGAVELEARTEMLFPFEASGVDTRWELRLPRASNQFDFRTLADVLLTIDYTALHSADYQQQVIRTLRPTLSAEQPFYFRDQFADQWYDLHNPDQTATPMTVRFTTRREDFPPNLDNLRIEQVLLAFVRRSGSPFEVAVEGLRFAEAGGELVGGGSTSVDGIISTRSGNAGSWTAMLGRSPVGAWELALPNDERTRRLFEQEQIEDILLVITYGGRTPPWPD